MDCIAGSSGGRPGERHLMANCDMFSVSLCVAFFRSKWAGLGLFFIGFGSGFVGIASCCG